MARTILVTLAGCALAIGGLVLAAGNAPGALQTLGLWILVLAWIALVGYHGARAERQERLRLGLPAPRPTLPSILTREWSMIQSIAVSILFVLMGLLGLLMAAGAADSSAQFMGLGLLVLSWFLLVGFHARRAEAEERARHGAAH